MSLYAQAEKDGEIKTITITSDSQQPPFHPGRVLVRFKGETRARVIPTPDPMAAVAKYRADNSVLYAEPDYVVRVDTTTPTDPLWPQQWDMAKIAAPQAWDTQTSASDVIVAIIDTGIDYTHPDLQSNLWVNPANGSHGFTCINGTCVAGGQDDYGHGTHVAGTIGAMANNGQGMAGINWRTQLLSCKFLDANGSGNVSDAILCFNQILTLKQQGFNIRVTSNSWGGDGYSQGLKDAMAAVEAAGILNVCAAGNSGVNADIAPMYPGAYDNRGIISVLASDSNDLGAYFTNYGVANVDIAAPGVSTLSTVPSGTCPLCDPSGYRVASGTSMATPHVSAVLAAMFHLNPALSAAEARDALLDPSSYDPLTDPIATMTSTGGRLNFAKAIASPRLMTPQLNGFPVLTAVANVFAHAGETITMTASASDPDGDSVRKVWQNSSFSTYTHWLMGYMLNTNFPSPSGDSVSFQAPALARTATAAYAVSVSDGKGGSASSVGYATVLPSSSPGLPPSGTLNVSPTSGPVGAVVSINFPAVDPEGGPVAWDLWKTGMSVASGWCCMTGPTSLTMYEAGAFRIGVQAMDRELNVSNRQSAVVRIGGATGTPPIASATLDKLSGAAPLTVNVDMTASTDPDGTIQNYIIVCDYGSNSFVNAGPRTSCVYNTPGTYWIMLQVKDNNGLLDLISAYAVVTPPSSTPPKTPATVVLSNMTQTYAGSPLIPTATTNPPGLVITWTNAPKTSAGSYAVTATVNDPNYEGSASATFVINKAPASVALSNMTQSYTGSGLAPAASTIPAGLGIGWTNAPQTNVGSYTVTATVNDSNYQGSASGTFTITGSSTPPTPPGVSITSPVSGPLRTGPVTIQAAVTQGTNPIVRVEFLINGSVKCTDTATPYTCSWNMPSAANKSYQLQAKAYDSTGQVGVSNTVTVTSSR